jgi:5-(carboxyamino)imidazole ribonucleotide synthase
MNTITPGSTIGIVGGGQLGRMLAIAAASMGYKTHIYTPEKDAPASQVATKTTIGAYQDATALRVFGQSVDVVTFEFENVPSETLTMLAEVACVRPKPEVLHITRNRIREKEFISACGTATAPYRAIRSREEMMEAVAVLKTPAILKTTELGYDGKGQVMIREAEEAFTAWQHLSAHEAILEGFVDFSREASVIVARGVGGEVRCYPLVENHHKHHILHRTIVPAIASESLAREAETIAVTLAERIDLVGIMAVEMFITRDEQILVNELAPRPHNSGHWTLDAAATSQFEQHIRAICGWSLGDTAALSPCEMVNLLGDDWLQWERYARDGLSHVHLYGKTESRPGRKMGHVTRIVSAEK